MLRAQSARHATTRTHLRDGSEERGDRLRLRRLREQPCGDEGAKPLAGLGVELGRRLSALGLDAPAELQRQRRRAPAAIARLGHGQLVALSARARGRAAAAFQVCVRVAVVVGVALDGAGGQAAEEREEAAQREGGALAARCVRQALAQLSEEICAPTRGGGRQQAARARQVRAERTGRARLRE